MYRIYLISLFITRVSVTFIEKKYKQAHGMTLTTTLLWSDASPSPSLLHCVATCSRVENCYAVGYSSVDLKCSYFHWFLGGEMSLNAVLGEDTERVVLVKPVPGKIFKNSLEMSVTECYLMRKY